ncbi:hypothetical protein HY251_08125 [bacterium]|nr:hypothetical protein [bacterium]
MKRFGLVLLLTGAVALGVARAQEKPATPDKPADRPADKPADNPAPDTSSDPKDKDTKAPDPAKAAPAGSLLAPGTVSRKGLFPLDDGRKWTYELKFWYGATGANPDEGPKDKPRTDRLEVLVPIGTAPVKIDDKDVRTLDYKLNGELAQSAFFREEEGKVLCLRRMLGVGEHKKTFDLVPAQPILSGELKVGSSWTWEGKTAAATGTESFTVLREERVKTPAGTFDTVLILATYKGSDDSTSSSAKWLSPGVGIVREETEVKTDKDSFRVRCVLKEMKTK